MPGSSKVRAILVNSVIFFSFNSEIVIDSPEWGLCGGSTGKVTTVRFEQKDCFWSYLNLGAACWVKVEGGQSGGAGLSRPPTHLNGVVGFGFLQNGHLFRGDQLQNLVHGFLNTSVRPVKLASGLGSELTQDITVLHGM